MLISFENKILRKIYGQTLEKGVWRRKTNREIRVVYGEPDEVRVKKQIQIVPLILRKNAEKYPT